MRYYISIFSFLILMNFSLTAQQGIDSASDEQPIELQNPSFESFPKLSKTPSGWWDCGFAGESEVDIHPVPAGEFKVDKEPYQGGSYVGMVVRENDTYEAIGQRLSSPLKGGHCYEFTIHLARSPLYMSKGRAAGNITNDVNYATPAKLRIWGGNGYCGKAELLAESSLIINSRWLEYNFRFEPTQDQSYITFEAFYKTPTLFPYNGNILLDNAQTIIPVPCDDINIPPTIAIAEPIPPKQGKTDPKPKVNIPPKKATVKPPLVETRPTRPEATIQGQRKDDLRIGSKILMSKLEFDADSTRIPPRSYESLNELYDFLAANPELQIEIGGHTNGQPAHSYCDYISKARAESVAHFLLERGIKDSRIKAVGYGKRQRIADDRTAYGRKKNQRVEIKILGFNG